MDVFKWLGAGLCLKGKDGGTEMEERMWQNEGWGVSCVFDVFSVHGPIIIVCGSEMANKRMSDNLRIKQRDKCSLGILDYGT